MTALANDCRDRVLAYVGFFETLKPDSLDEVERYFAHQVHFKDPFHDVVGRAAVRRIFEHMFETTEAPRFRIDDWMVNGDAATIRWRFQCGMQGLGIEFPGMSFVRFDGHGQVTEHIDYWDPAEGIYEKVPLLGVLMRHLRRRIAAFKAAR